MVGKEGPIRLPIGFRSTFQGRAVKILQQKKTRNIGTLRKNYANICKKHCTLKKTIMFIKKPWYSWWLRNPAITSWYGKYPIIYRVSYMLGGCLGFLPSTPDTFRSVPWGPDTKSLGDARHLFNVKWIPFTRPRRLGDVYPRYPMQEAMECFTPFELRKKPEPTFHEILVG